MFTIFALVLWARRCLLYTYKNIYIYMFVFVFVFLFVFCFVVCVFLFFCVFVVLLFFCGCLLKQQKMFTKTCYWGGGVYILMPELGPT